MRAHIHGRLDRAPRDRQKLVEVPLGLGDPVWADNPGFDVADHVLRAGRGDFQRLVDGQRRLEQSAWAPRDVSTALPSIARASARTRPLSDGTETMTLIPCTPKRANVTETDRAKADTARWRSAILMAQKRRNDTAATT